jgi:ankyrin repeat protein
MKKMPLTAESDRELFAADVAGDLKQLRSLLTKGADANTPNAAGQTTLMLAAARLSFC